MSDSQAGGALSDVRRLRDFPDSRTLLHKYDLWPRKSLGQNFLVDPGAPDKIADCAKLSTEDTVLEIGAGLGALTAALATRARRVIAVETDPSMVAALGAELGDVERIRIVHGDILELDPRELLSGTPALEDLSFARGPDRALWGPRLSHYQVVANLPYYITGAVVQRLLEATVRPARLTITVQLEVAQRMAAKPGDMSLLSVSTQFYGKPRICLRLKRGAFYPVPNVSSAVLRLDLYDEPPVPVDDVARFFDIAKAGFAQRRKQLRNTLAASLRLEPTDVEAALQSQGIDHRRRAETLTIQEWGTVYAALAPLLQPA